MAPSKDVFFRGIKPLLREDKGAKLKILVLMGGISAERDVSLASGEAIVKALKSAGHKVIALDTAEGQNLLPDTGKYIPEGVKTEPPDIAELEKKGKELALKAIDSFDFSEVDVIFLALHGGQGEDGTIQALLDMTGKPYTGSGVLASALAMNKAMSKKIFEREGILTPDWLLVEDSDLLVHTHLSDLSTIADRIEKNLGFPCVVKPNDQGSTVGFSIVNEKGELEKAFDFAKKYSRQFLVEKYIPGRELTVGILGDQALPVVEIVPEHGVYDYECKYTSGKSNYIAPAEIPEDRAKEIQAIGLKAFKALGCEGYARTDFRFGEDDRFYCLEVNTLPGMTAHSLVPKAAKAIGIDFPKLVDRIAKLALKKRRV